MSKNKVHTLIKRILREKSGSGFDAGVDQNTTPRRRHRPNSPALHASKLPVPRIGIALGAGAARGWAHIGVIKALENAGISADIVAGTSIGAVAGGCYAAGKINQLEAFAKSLSLRRLVSFLDFNFSGSGIITGNRLHKALEMHLESKRIEELRRPFVSVATELGSGNEIWLKRGSITNAIRASYALPGIFKPVNIKGQWLTDGALVNPIPVSVCRAMGAEIVIAVNLNNDRTGMCEADLNSESPELENSENQSDRRCEDAPGIRSVINDALNITQNSIARARLAYEPPDMTINPRLEKIGMFDFHRAAETIALGEQATELALRRIKRPVSTPGLGDNQILAPAMAGRIGHEEMRAHYQSTELAISC